MNTPLNQEIVELIKEHLKTKGYKGSLESFESELKSHKGFKNETLEKTKISKLIGGEKDKAKDVNSQTDNYKVLEKKHQSILQCGRQILSIAKTCLTHLQNIKDGTASNENLAETIENYKSYIGKYHKIILTDEWTENVEMMTTKDIVELKSRLIKSKDEKKNEILIENLYGLRVHSLQIPSESRRKFVLELIKNDVFFQNENKLQNNFMLSLLNMHAYNIRHALLSNLSIIVSCMKGVEYLLQNGTAILHKIIDIMKNQEDGSIIQRFCISIIYKMSIKEEVIHSFISQGIIDWIFGLLQRSKYTEIPIFCLDYVTALLVNILHSDLTIKFLEDNITICKNAFEICLTMIKENIPNTVLMNIIITFSFLTKSKFHIARTECKFYERISEFVEFYSSSKTKDENSEVDKKNILDLCTYMFLHKDPNDKTEDEKNDFTYSEVIKEFENEQGHLIFECFQDEIN